MVGPLKKGSDGFTHLLVAVNKFPKWIEAKPITNIRSEEVIKFFLNIIYRFGIPNCIITDHGTNFIRKKFLDFSNGYDIKIDWALVGHPHTNGQVERANGMGCRGPSDPLEPKNDPKLIHGIHPFILGIQSRSSVTI